MTKDKTIRQVFNYAYKEARQAGLDPNTADAVAHSVIGRLQNVATDMMPRILEDEIRRHAAP